MSRPTRSEKSQKAKEIKNDLTAKDIVEEKGDKGERNC